MPEPLKIGTRGSPLALWQAERVRTLIARATGVECRIEILRTRAENLPDRDLAAIGVGAFTKELDDALLAGAIDLAVHSAKDIPSALPRGLEIASFPERASPYDAFAGAGNATIATLPSGARVGTGSPRRRAQILVIRPDLEVVPLRGNVETRLRKIASEGLAGTILAEAGLRRLGRESVISEILDADWMLPAAGQGAIAVVARDHGDARSSAHLIDDAVTRSELEAERAFLRELRGGCQAPAGALARSKADTLLIRAVIADTDGRRALRGVRESAAANAPAAAVDLARELLARGGDEILRSIRGTPR